MLFWQCPHVSHVTDLKLNAFAAKEKFQAAIKDVQEKMDAELEDGSDVEGTPMKSPHGIRSRGKDIRNRLLRKLRWKTHFFLSGASMHYNQNYHRNCNYTNTCCSGAARLSQGKRRLAQCLGWRHETVASICATCRKIVQLWVEWKKDSKAWNEAGVGSISRSLQNDNIMKHATEWSLIYFPTRGCYMSVKIRSQWPL